MKGIDLLYPFSYIKIYKLLAKNINCARINQRASRYAIYALIIITLHPSAVTGKYLIISSTLRPELTVLPEYMCC